MDSIAGNLYIFYETSQVQVCFIKIASANLLKRC